MLCTPSTQNTYNFNENNILLNSLTPELKKQLFFDIKRNGDHLQVLATHILNIKKNGDGIYSIFCSIDRLAIQFARLIGVPCILVNNTTGEMTLYKGNFNQLPEGGNANEIEKNILRFKLKKLEKRLELLENEGAAKNNFYLEKILKKYKLTDKKQLFGYLNSLFANLGTTNPSNNLFKLSDSLNILFKSKIKNVVEKNTKT